jgi:hypothetical protein
MAYNIDEELFMHVRTDLKAGQGLGDTVADLTHVTGLDRLAQAYTQVTGKDCGCEARRETLNRLFPFSSSSA